MDKDTTNKQHTNLVEILEYRALSSPGKTAYIFLKDNGKDEVIVTYKELALKAKSVASTLSGANLKPGSRVLLMYPPGLDFIFGFFGCLYAGLIAVPVNVTSPAKFETSPVKAIMNNALPAAVLTTSKITGISKEAFLHYKEFESVLWFESDLMDTKLDSERVFPEITTGQTAFLQYTSGSTRHPKGVIIGHDNIMHNAEYIKKGVGLSENDVAVSWLPFFHDMGIMNGIMLPLYTGYMCVLMSPVSFLKRPEKWLKAISRYKATYSGGPNFAFKWCVERISSKKKENLDLSAWRCAFNGSEPIRTEVLDSFAAAFASCGFQSKALYPCYGLAEATVAVTGSITGNGAVSYEVDEKAFSKSTVIVNGQKDQKAKTLVGSGTVKEGMTVIIADPVNRKQCSSDRIGEIWVKGGSVSRGYWMEPAETEKVFNAYLADSNEGPFLRTGDLGFFVENQLIITGRLKNMIIIRGENYYPQDIEWTAGRCHQSLANTSCAAFSVEKEEEEKLVVVQEIKHSFVRQAAPGEIAQIAEYIKNSIAEHNQISAEVLLVRQGSIPKTTSGKIQRGACKNAYLNNTLSTLFTNNLLKAAEEHS